MQRRIFKNLTIISIIFLISLFCLNSIVLGTEEPLSNDDVIVGEINENPDDLANTSNSNESRNTIVSENRVGNETQNSFSNNTSNDEDVYSTQNQNVTNSVGANGQESSITKTPNTPQKQINSYSTVGSLPEANLGLNNILNVILIAIGIIIILLAIAILIRLKQ